MKKVNIGLDIGIASVGWAVLDEELTILEHGVRLFPTVDSTKDSKLENETRREKRAMRRHYRRLRNRKKDFVRLLNDYDLFKGNITDFRVFLSKNNQSVYKLRKKALKEKLPQDDFLKILYWYLSNRGFSYDVSENKEEAKKEDKTKLLVKNYDGKQNPVDYQLDIGTPHDGSPEEISTNLLVGKIRGSGNRDLSRDNYAAELKKILDTQKFSKNKFNDDYLALFSRQRSFESGPGGPKSPTKYGLYQRMEDGTIKKCWETIWEKTVGKCSVYPGEYRAPKVAPSSELFNLLNDLNNLTCVGEKISPDVKKDLLAKLFDHKFSKVSKYTKNNLTLKLVSKAWGVDEQLISGYKKDKNEKAVFTKLEGFHKIKEHLVKNNANFLTGTYNALSWKCLDQIALQLNSTLSIESRTEKLNKEVFNNLENYKITLDSAVNLKQLIEDLAELDGFENNHALSLRAISEEIPLLFETTQNHMQIVSERKKLQKEKNENSSSSKNNTLTFLKKDKISEIVTTPTVKRSLTQSVNLLNAIFKLCKQKDWTIDHIVLEMARERNNKEENEKTNNIQRVRREMNIVVDAYFNNKKPTSAQRLKIWLWKQQKECDVYDGKPLTFSEALNCDIDHIIPYTQCYDDSRNNKVLTKRTLNSEKGQKTPYQWMSSETFNQMNMRWKDWYANKVPERKALVSSSKYRFITSKEDYSLGNNVRNFLSRNLVDTQYAMRELLALLKNNFVNSSTKILTINGRITSFIRKQISPPFRGNEKAERLTRPTDYNGNVLNEYDENGNKMRFWHGHHAEDAVLAVYGALSNYQAMKIIEKDVNYYQESEFKPMILQKLKKQWEKSRDELNSKMAKVRFSRMKTTKRNIEIHNQSLYSCQNSEKGFKKITNLKLIKLSNKNCAEYFGLNTKISNNVLMKKSDSALYKELQKIYLNYAEEKNPFKAAAKNSNKYIMIMINGSSKFIKNIKVTKEEKSEDEIIFGKRGGFFDTLGWVAIELFKKPNGKYFLLPLNAKMVTFPIRNFQNIKEYKNFYYYTLEKENLEKKNKIFTFHKGTIIRDVEKKLYYICGYVFNKRTLELKPLEHRFIEDKNNKRIRPKINSKKLKNCEIGNIDYLGNFFSQLKI